MAERDIFDFLRRDARAPTVRTGDLIPAIFCANNGNPKLLLNRGTA